MCLCCLLSIKLQCDVHEMCALACDPCCMFLCSVSKACITPVVFDICYCSGVAFDM